MGKGWGPGTTGAGYTGKSYRSAAPDPYGWPPSGQPNAACRAPSSACELRWTLEMVAAVEVAGGGMRLWPAVATGPTPAPVPALACSTSQ